MDKGKTILSIIECKFPDAEINYDSKKKRIKIKGISYKEFRKRIKECGLEITYDDILIERIENYVMLSFGAKL